MACTGMNFNISGLYKAPTFIIAAGTTLVSAVATGNPLMAGAAMLAAALLGGCIERMFNGSTMTSRGGELDLLAVAATVCSLMGIAAGTLALATMGGPCAAATAAFYTASILGGYALGQFGTSIA
ncbi:MAG: hypothetical protein ACOYKZ_02820 [Chlamydiia bacterium]